MAFYFQFLSQQLQEYAQTALGSQIEPTFNQPFQLSTPLQPPPPFSLVQTSLCRKFAGQCNQDSSSKIYFMSPGSEKPFFQYACQRIVADIRPHLYKRFENFLARGLCQATYVFTSRVYIVDFFRKSNYVLSEEEWILT
ncbi:hypothetical protein Hanom_Chr10g00967361 [Helianthus anomalus]